MNKLLIAASLALTGCAGFGDISPEQAAALMHMNSRQAPIAPAQPIYQPRYLPQAAPVYVAPQPVYVAPRPTIHCTSRNGGYAIYTTCQ